MFDRLPNDIIVHIFSFFPNPQQLNQISLVSKKWKCISESDSLWKKFGFSDKQNLANSKINYKNKSLELAETIRKLGAKNGINIALLGTEDSIKHQFAQLVKSQPCLGGGQSNVNGIKINYVTKLLLNKFQAFVFDVVEQNISQLESLTKNSNIVILFPKNPLELNAMLQNKMLEDKLRFVISDKNSQIWNSHPISGCIIIDTNEMASLDTNSVLDKILQKIISNMKETVEPKKCNIM